MKKSEKSRGITFILCTFFGGLGIHRMYVGRIGSGVTMMILTMSVIGVVISGPWSLIDWIKIMARKFKDEDGFLL